MNENKKVIAKMLQEVEENIENLNTYTETIKANEIFSLEIKIVLLNQTTILRELKFIEKILFRIIEDIVN